MHSSLSTLLVMRLPSPFPLNLDLGYWTLETRGGALSETAVLCCDALHCGTLGAALCCAVPCRAVPRRVVLCCVVLGSAVLRHLSLRCVPLSCVQGQRQQATSIMLMYNK